MRSGHRLTSPCTFVLNQAELCLDSLLQTYEPAEVMRKHYPVTFFGIDREGCPISHEALGSADAHGIMK